MFQTMATIVEALATAVMAWYAISAGQRAEKNEKKFQVVLNALVLANCVSWEENKDIRTQTVDNIKKWLKDQPPESWLVND